MFPIFAATDGIYIGYNWIFSERKHLIMYRSSSLAKAVCRSHPINVVFRTRHIRTLLTGARQVQTFRINNGYLRNEVTSRLHRVELRQTAAKFSSDAGLPEHYKIPLPALSPTMEMGTLVRWAKAEGDSLSEGDLLAEIETDKATMGFETPEEGYLARILVPEGTKDIPIGKLLCIIVNNKEDVAAFADFSVKDTDISSVSQTAPPSGSPKPTPSKDYPKHVEVKLPALSPTMEKGTIGNWIAEEGSKLSEGDILVQIETDKATMDFETPEEGYLAKIVIPSGSKDVPLGQVLCVIVEDEADISAFKDYSAPTPAAVTADTPAATMSRAPTTPPPSTSRPPTTTTQAVAPPASEGRVAASPYARTLAKEKGIDLSLIKGTGPDGRIIAKDVENFVPPAVAPCVGKDVPVAAPIHGALYTDIPLSNIRKVIAKRLVESKTTIPHYYLTIDVEMENTIRLRKELNDLLKKEEIKISVNDFIVKAAALACKKIPAANSAWHETYIREYHTVDVCVAVATDDGLITPIVFQAEKKGLAAISEDIKELAEKARSKSLQPHEFQGGTFTVSNLGMFGIKHFSAVINPPQACILAVGGARKTLVVDEDHQKGYKPATVMTVTLSCDHRVIDGAVGSQWLQHFKRYMEKPQTMLL